MIAKIDNDKPLAKLLVVDDDPLIGVFSTLLKLILCRAESTRYYFKGYPSNFFTFFYFFNSHRTPFGAARNSAS